MNTPRNLVRTVRGYYNSNKNKPNRNYGENWFRVLIAFGDETHDTLTPYTAEEARKSEKVWSGWRPVRQELERLEEIASRVSQSDAVDIESGDAEDASYKADQDLYAEEVEQFQAARDSGDPGAQNGFYEWRRPNREMFPWNGVYVLDTRFRVPYQFRSCVPPSCRVDRNECPLPPRLRPP